MPKRSPGPEWAVLQGWSSILNCSSPIHTFFRPEPTPSSHEDSEDELEPENDVLSSPLKRKGGINLPPITSKRAKLSPQQDGRADGGSSSSKGQGSSTGNRFSY
jgi:hypothetical protein